MRNFILALILSFLPWSVLPAQAPRIFPADKLPPDARLEPLRDLNGYFPMQAPASRHAWTQRSTQLRRQILVSQGLWPMPQKSELNATIHGKQDMDGYSIEKVYFESMPGFFVSGSLYRPLNAKGKRPAILCPHGHWSQGRFYDAPADTLKEQLANGAEVFSEGGRNPIQARCVHLARLGCIVFNYDMVGYADSQQISYDVAHRFARQRPEMNHRDQWGFFSPQAETHLQNVMGLQTWNSIRSLDFLLTLPDVDPKRLAVTGASGGGTQTFILSAIDPRIQVSMPAVMVSTAMQGGCTCENASLLRIGAGNVDFAALFAPKPLGLTAANDWTVEMETKGYPELKNLFQMLGKPDHLHLEAHIHFPHNYNHVCRKAMYQWFNQHLHLGFQNVPEERDYRYQNAEQLTVWNKQHPQPAGGAELERQVVQHWEQNSQQQIDSLLNHRRASLTRYREVVGGGIDIVIGKQLSPQAHIHWEEILHAEKSNHDVRGGILKNSASGSANPVLFLTPENWNQTFVLWLSENGKSGLYGKDGNPSPDVQKLLNAGCCVVGVDLLFQGEYLSGDAVLEKTRRVASNSREAAAYSFGYNSSLFARRVHDVLTVTSYLSFPDSDGLDVRLIALDQTGPIAIAARAQAKGAISRLAVHTGNFRFADVNDIHSPQFLPGGARYHDLPGMLAVAAPLPTWINGEKHIPAVVKQCYQLEKALDQFVLYHPFNTKDLIDWVLNQP